MKKITIHSDGYGAGTVIVDEDGVVLDCVVSATIYLQAREANTANLEVLVPSTNVKVIVKDVTLICPLCTESQTHECGPNTLGGTVQ